MMTLIGYDIMIWCNIYSILMDNLIDLEKVFIFKG